MVDQVNTMWYKSFKAALIGLIFKFILSACTPMPVASPAGPTMPTTPPATAIVTLQAVAPAATPTPTPLPPTATPQAPAILPRPLRTEIVPPGLVVPKLTPTPVAGQPTGVAPTSLKVEERARLDLAKRLGVTEDKIQIVRVLTDEMPIDRLNCGDPLQKGTPVTRPAFVFATEIKLKVNDKTYTYYAQGSRLVYCGIK